MNHARLAILASTSLCLGFSASNAADMALKAPRAPVAMDPWVGFYAGGNFGYSWGRTDTSISVLPFGLDNLANFGTFGFPGAANSASSNVNGAIGGGQFGFVGRIAPHWLGGVEADIQWSGQKGSVRGQVAGLAPECTSGNCSFTNAHDITTRLNWFGTFRGRAGAEFDGFWIYGTAGFAYGSVSVSGTNNLVLIDNNGPAVVGSFVTPYSYSQLKGGWTAGLGIEGLIGDGHWRWKLEYLHIDLGSINGGMFGGFPTVQANTNRFTDEIVRVGFNYKLDSDRRLDGGIATKAPALGWTGWYVGVNAGYFDSVGRTNADVAIVGTSSSLLNGYNLVNSGTNQFNHGSSGVIGGAQAGYNYQFSPSLVAGLEADIQGTGLALNSSATRAAGVGPFSPNWVTTTTAADRLDYLGTVRARIGVTPRSDLMLYSTGGLAYGGVRSSTQIAFDNTGGAIPGATSGSLSSTRFGWTAGGGGEWMFSPKWTAKLEYLYYDLGSVTYATGGYAVDVGPTGFPGFGVETIATRTTTRLNGNIVRVGLNYKLGS